MSAKDAEKVIRNLQERQFLCTAKEIIAGEYVVARKSQYDRLKKASEE